MTRARLLLLLAIAVPPGCAQEPLVGTFTSEVVQRDTCRVVGDGPETCTRDEGLSLLRVTLVEVDDGRIWLHGLPHDGDPDTSVLGTRDAEGGFLFVTETVQRNAETGCVLTSRRELALRVDEGALAEAVGEDPCVPLIGRETESTTTSAPCDAIHDPPEQIVRIARRRWQKPLECAAQ